MVIVVALEGAVNDWAVYMHPMVGWPRYWPHARDYAARHGDKLSDDDAARVFPVLNPARYRR